jgi:hypothetical protein
MRHEYIVATPIISDEYAENEYYWGQGGAGHCA